VVGGSGCGCFKGYTDQYTINQKSAAVVNDFYIDRYPTNAKFEAVDTSSFKTGVLNTTCRDADLLRNANQTHVVAYDEVVRQVAFDSSFLQRCDRSDEAC
jgi:hypothetical protein